MNPKEAKKGNKQGIVSQYKKSRTKEVRISTLQLEKPQSTLCIQSIPHKSRKELVDHIGPQGSDISIFFQIPSYIDFSD